MNLHPAGAAAVEIASTTALLAGAAITAAPASADTPNCVTKSEYRQVEIAMTMKKAHRTFDFNGSRIGIDGNQQVRGYRACGDPADSRNVGLDLVRENGIWYVVQKFRVA